MLEEDTQLLIMCLKEYIKDIDGEEFKQIFLEYVEYMARNYDQDCFIDEYDLMMKQVKKFVEKYNLDLSVLSAYKKDAFYRFIKSGYDKQDILDLYYFNDDVCALECFIDTVDSKYN